MFANIIKNLRLSRGMTQETLAETLSISPQAVSRWECGLAMPDISLIAPLCYLFDVTADDLLEIRIHEKREQQDAYTEVYGVFARTVNKTDALRTNTIRQLREGVRLYPDNRLLKRQLALVLWFNVAEPVVDEDTAAIPAAYLSEKAEMCRLCEDLLRDTADDTEREQLTAMYCDYARCTGNQATGKILAERLPACSIQRRLCYARCCDDWERADVLLGAMRQAWGDLRAVFLSLITETNAPAEEILAIRQKQETIHATLFEDDDVVRYADFDEYKVARALYRAGDDENAARYLRLCLGKWTGDDAITHSSPWRTDALAGVM